jgi:chaperonin GroEL
MAVPVETKEQIAATASISAGDSVIGEIIAEAIDKVGKEGVVTVEESNTFGIQLELTEGMRFDKGYVSQYMVTDPDRQEAILEDAYILIANSKISNMKDLLPIVDKVMQAGKPLADHRRGHRGRSPCNPGCEQDSWHLQVGSRQGSWLW